MSRSEVRAREVLIWVTALVLSAGDSLAAAAVAPSAGRQMAARVQRLEDDAEIRRLLTDYGRLLDARDFAGYSRLFAQRTGEWVGGFGTARGSAAIRKLMEDNIGRMAPATPGASHHLLTNFEIDLDGGRATAWSRWSFVTQSPEKRPQIVFSGHYDDQLVREKGRWKFQRRVVSTDIPAGEPPAN